MKTLIILMIALAAPEVRAESLKDKFLNQNHFVDDRVFAEIYQLAEKYNGADSQERAYATELQNLYCEGSTPKFIVKRTVNFVPVGQTDTPLDYASEQASKQMDMAKFFFKNDFIYASGWGKDLSHYLLHRSYREDDTNNDERYISASQYHQFFFKNKQLALDMGFLIKHFTFKIPQHEIGSMYKAPGDMLLMNKFGYTKNGFQASEVINFKDYIWRYVLIHDTEVKEALKDDGSIVFQIEWTPSLFCKYGVPVSALKSL